MAIYKILCWWIAYSCPSTILLLGREHYIHPNWFKSSLSIKLIDSFYYSLQKDFTVVCFLFCSRFFLKEELHFYRVIYIRFFSFAVLCREKSLGSKIRYFSLMFFFFFRSFMDTILHLTSSYIWHSFCCVICRMVFDCPWFFQLFFSVLNWFMSILIPLPQWLNYYNFIICLHIWE